MNTKKILLMALSLILAQGCNEPQAPDHGNTTTPLSCITFTDTAFGIYAMTHWDADSNGCLTFSEAQTVQALPDNAFAGNTALQSISDLNSFPNFFFQPHIGYKTINAEADCHNSPNQGQKPRQIPTRKCELRLKTQITADLNGHQ